MVKTNILVVDDEPDIRRLVREILEDEGYNVVVAKDGARAREVLADTTPNLILLDIWMPDIDGISLLKELQGSKHFACPVIMMSGHGTVEAAVEATRLGARDFIEKPLSLSKLLSTVENALSASAPSVAVNDSRLNNLVAPVEMIGKSQAALSLKQSLDRCAQHNITVLMEGEQGTGKTHCAKYIHTHSLRKSEPFVIMRTASMLQSQRRDMSEQLLGSLRNGKLHPGLLDQVGAGTLYIDDVVDLDEDSQSALFRVLSAGTYQRVNTNEVVTVSLRVIAASSYNLEQALNSGKLRSDLYHHLNGFRLSIPSLRVHNEDIPELLQYFVNMLSDNEGLSYRSFSLAAQNRLRNYHWPGNILELEQMVRRLLIQGGTPSIALEEVEALLSHAEARGLRDPIQDGAPLMQSGFDLPLRQAREQFEKAYLEYHLKKSDGSVGKVAKLAGLERTHLYRKLRALNIETKSGFPLGKDG